jgi:hypothetical protein
MGWLIEEIFGAILEVFAGLIRRTFGYWGCAIALCVVIALGGLVWIASMD